MNISLDYTLNYEEWAEAFRASNRSIRGRRPIVGLIIIAAALTAVWIILAMGYAPSLLSKLIYILGPAWLIGILSWLIIARKIADLAQVEWKSNPTLRGRCTIRLDESALTIVQEYREATWKWPAFVKFDETANVILLYISSRSFMPIPKRTFSKADLEEFSDFLMRTLPPANPVSAGFSVIAKDPQTAPVHVQPLEPREFI